MHGPIDRPEYIDATSGEAVVIQLIWGKFGYAQEIGNASRMQQYNMHCIVVLSVKKEKSI